MAKDDEQILFPGVEVAGQNVRPWVLRQTVALAPTLETLVDIVAESGVGDVLSEILDSIDIDKTTISSIAEVMRGRWKDIVKASPRLLLKIVPLAPKILSVSLGLTEEEVGEYDNGKTVDLLKAVAVQNWDYLKNYFGPGAAGKGDEEA